MKGELRGTRLVGDSFRTLLSTLKAKVRELNELLSEEGIDELDEGVRKEIEVAREETFRQVERLSLVLNKLWPVAKDLGELRNGSAKAIEKNGNLVKIIRRNQNKIPAQKGERKVG